MGLLCALIIKKDVGVLTRANRLESVCRGRRTHLICLLASELGGHDERCVAKGGEARSAMFDRHGGYPSFTHAVGPAAIDPFKLSTRPSTPPHGFTRPGQAPRGSRSQAKACVLVYEIGLGAFPRFPGETNNDDFLQAPTKPSYICRPLT